MRSISTTAISIISATIPYCVRRSGTPFDRSVMEDYCVVWLDYEADMVVALFHDISPDISRLPGFEYVDVYEKGSNEVWTRVYAAPREDGECMDAKYDGLSHINID